MKKNGKIEEQIYKAKGQEKVLLHEEMLGRDYKKGGK